ncbi:MAG: hypothetical protein KC776_10405 [Myxococcales bacterium]|nr:hypothetical protein [Myxococcales bacterium]MCB9577683.1 hypothetical protein [Polyangiaceae bacterium]
MRLALAVALVASVVACGPREPASRAELAFEGVNASGKPARITLGDFSGSRLLVILETGGAWCGTSRDTAAHFDDALGELRGRVDRLDLMTTDRDNAPAEVDDAAAWQMERAAGVPVGIDSGFAFGAPGMLPRVLLVDEASMEVVDSLANPSTFELRGRVAAALGEPPPDPHEELVDGLFHDNEWRLFQAMAEVPGAPPPDPTNEVADSPAARRLGKALFFDAGLSSSKDVSCATCHDPAKALSDARPQALGAALGDRRTPSIALSAHARWQMWDGRADTLWAQALLPFENPKEMASSREDVSARVLGAHGDAYRAAFPAAAPDATRVFVNAGKAIAAYERTFRVRPTRFDAYVLGDFSALSEDEKYGLVVFARSGCTQCHWGPRLTDDAFHVTRVATGRADGHADRGRADGIAAWAESEFRADGPYSAAPALGQRAHASAALLGQFKTPSLRGVAELSFFGHGGKQGALSDVTVAYGSGGLPPDDPRAVGGREPWLSPFGETAQWGLVPFLKTLTAETSVPRVGVR